MSDSVRDINIIPIAEKVFKQVQELFPNTTVNLTNYLVDKAYEYWQLRAKNAPQRKDGSPSLWGNRYANTLKVELAGAGNKGTAKVYVDESHPDYMFVKLVEEGVKSWSIKDALLAGKAARRNQALYGTVFVRVPFRFRIPGVSKESESFAGILPSDVYEKAKQGIALGKEYGKHAGLQRFDKGVHGQYMTFRTVSQSSRGWMYPAKSPTPVYEEVKARVGQMMEQAILNMVKGFVKEMEKEHKQ